MQDGTNEEKLTGTRHSMFSRILNHNQSFSKWAIFHPSFFSWAHPGLKTSPLMLYKMQHSMSRWKQKENNPPGDYILSKVHFPHYLEVDRQFCYLEFLQRINNKQHASSQCEAACRHYSTHRLFCNCRMHRVLDSFMCTLPHSSLYRSLLSTSGELETFKSSVENHHCGLPPINHQQFS